MNLELKAKCPNIKPIPATEYPYFISNLGVRLAKGLGISQYELRLIEQIPGQTSFDEVAYYALGKGLIGRPNWKSDLIRFLESKGFEYDSAKNVFTFEYLNHQITVNIVDDPIKLENSALFYAYGGIGRIYALFAKKMGFVFDLKGLRIPVTYNGQLISEIDYMTYYHECLNAIGFMPRSYDRRFYSQENMINEIITARYFSKQVFEGELDAELLASPAYALLAAKLADPNVKNNHDYNSGKTPWVALIKKSNPAILLHIKTLLRTKERMSQIDSKLSNELITGVIGTVTDKDMDKFKETFKASFKPEEDFDHYILSSSVENLQERVRKVFEQSGQEDEISKSVSVTSVIPVGASVGDVFTSGKFELKITTLIHSENYGNVQVLRAPASCPELIGSTRSLQLAVKPLEVKTVAPKLKKDGLIMNKYNPY